MMGFFSPETCPPPVLGGAARFALFLGVCLVFFISLKYLQKKEVSRFFYRLQIFQMVLLYGWYLAVFMPLSESLPLYHCRLAVLALLFLKSPNKLKKYFALIGVFGPLCALLDPTLDPYPLFHVTFLSYMIGHYALLGNGLFSLYQERKTFLSYKDILSLTAILNAVLLFVNQLTGGNYGFLSQPPLVGNQGLLGNYLLVSFVFIAALSLLNAIFVQIFAKTDDLAYLKN